MGIRASLSFRYIAPTTRTAKSSILTPKIAKIPFAENRDGSRPDSSKLHHPPPSLPNCGTAETGEIFRAVGGVFQD